MAKFTDVSGKVFLGLVLVLCYGGCIAMPIFICFWKTTILDITLGSSISGDIDDGTEFAIIMAKTLATAFSSYGNIGLIHSYFKDGNEDGEAWSAPWKTGAGMLMVTAVFGVIFYFIEYVLINITLLPLALLSCILGIFVGIFAMLFGAAF